MDDNKHKIWSEGRGMRSTAEDALEGLDFEHLDAIKEQSTKNGIVYTGNCMHCGRQWKMVTKWVELAAWFVGQPVPETVPTRQGVLTQPRCPVCTTEQRFLVPWHEVKNHIDDGVRSGVIDSKIYQATIFGAPR